MHRLKIISLTAGAMLISGVTMSNENINFYELSAATISNEEVQLSKFKAKAVLVVNVASKCGFTGQYAGLESLYQDYKDKGLIIVGFPSNDFGGQEPGTNDEIASFCKLNYGVTFPMMAKVPVKGSSKHPIYAFLTEGPKPGEVGWNFEKFLVDENGAVVDRFKSRVSPDSKDLRAAIDGLLAN